MWEPLLISTRKPMSYLIVWEAYGICLFDQNTLVITLILFCLIKNNDNKMYIKVCEDFFRQKGWCARVFSLFSQNDSTSHFVHWDLKSIKVVPSLSNINHFGSSAKNSVKLEPKWQK